jgi:pyrimidine dimer DNA glycosylase
VQTFLPYPSFAQSARVLDPPRLGKQRVEALQLLRAVTIPTYGWRHHPAAKMWRGFVPALTKYGLEMTDAWIELGHADTVRPQLLLFAPEVDALSQEQLELPPWLGDEAFHLSHRSNLIRKDPEFYRQHFGDLPGDLPYIWPAAVHPLGGGEQPSTSGG